MGLPTGSLLGVPVALCSTVPGGRPSVLPFAAPRTAEGLDRLSLWQHGMGSTNR